MNNSLYSQRNYRWKTTIWKENLVRRDMKLGVNNEGGEHEPLEFTKEIKVSNTNTIKQNDIETQK